LALQYAKDVVAKRKPACKQVRQACKRQLDDLVRFKAGDNLYWDAALAGKACRFIERLPHVKGPKAKAGELIILEPWQCFIVTTIFGWRRKDTGGRRFRRSYVEVPRGNAKSTLSSAIALYCLTADGEEGPEVYSAATTRDQAKIVFGDAQQMMRKRRDFAAKLGVYVNQHNIICPVVNGSFWPLSRESGTMDGKNVHCAIIDELHAHKDRGIYDVIETGAAKRFSSLLWVITTAGSDTAGICYELRTYVHRVLDGVIEDDSQFGVVYTLDEDDDWTDPSNWEKANPNWGISVMPDAFAQLAKKAMQVASAQNNFKTKHLDLWVNADVAWMEMRAWDRCGDPDLSPELFASGDPCVLALDLATKTDICSKAKLFKKMHPKWTEGCTKHEGAGALDCEVCYPPTAEHEAHYYLFVDNFLPEDAIHDGRNSQYQGWAIEGHLIETPGSVLDFGYVKQSIIEDFAQFNVREVPYDPWQTAQLAQELQEQQGIPVIEYRATVLNFSAPMKELEALVLQRRLHHNASPVMRWMVSNVVCHLDAKDNIYPRKEQPQNKIDGVVATIMALGRALLLDDPYSDRGFLQL
jgi:phage terminase large subunit-like protein